MKKGTSHTEEVNKLKKIEGQVRGIIKMIEEERYCVDILHQFLAIHSALTSVELNVMRGHIEGCVQDSMKNRSANNSKELIDEMMDIITRVKKGRA